MLRSRRPFARSIVLCCVVVAAGALPDSATSHRGTPSPDPHKDRIPPVRVWSDRAGVSRLKSGVDLRDVSWGLHWNPDPGTSLHPNRSRTGIGSPALAGKAPNAPSMTSVSAVMSGADIGVTPTTLRADLLSDQTMTQTLSVQNTSGSDLGVNIHVRPPPPGAGSPGPCAPTTAFVTQEDLGGSLVSIDLATGSVVPVVSSGLSRPYGVTLDAVGTRAYVTDSYAGSLVTIDVESGAMGVVASGLIYPLGVVLNATNTRAYVADLTALEKIDLATGEVTRVGPTFSVADGVAVNVAESTAYVTDSHEGTLTAIDLATGSTRTVSAGLSDPRTVTLDPTGATAYVAQADGSQVVVIDLSTGAQTYVGSGLSVPIGLALAGTTAYVTEFFRGEVATVDLTTGTVRVAAMGLGYPKDIALNCTPSFIRVVPDSVVAPPAGSVDLGVTFDSKGLVGGDYDAGIEVRSHDSAGSEVTGDRDAGHRPVPGLSRLRFTLSRALAERNTDRLERRH